MIHGSGYSCASVNQCVITLFSRTRDFTGSWFAPRQNGCRLSDQRPLWMAACCLPLCGCLLRRVYRRDRCWRDLADTALTAVRRACPSSRHGCAGIFAAHRLHGGCIKLESLTKATRCQALSGCIAQCSLRGHHISIHSADSHWLLSFLRLGGEWQSDCVSGKPTSAYQHLCTAVKRACSLGRGGICDGSKRAGFSGYSRSSGTCSSSSIGGQS